MTDDAAPSDSSLHSNLSEQRSSCDASNSFWCDFTVAVPKVERYPVDWKHYTVLKTQGLDSGAWQKMPRSRRPNRSDRTVYHDAENGIFYAEELRRLLLDRTPRLNVTPQMDYDRALKGESTKRRRELEWLRCAPLLGFATPEKFSFAYHHASGPKPEGKTCGIYAIDYRAVTAMSAVTGKSVTDFKSEPGHDDAKEKMIFDAAYEAQIVCLVCADPYRSPNNTFVGENGFTHIGFEGIREPEYMAGMMHKERASKLLAENFVGSAGLLMRDRVLEGLQTVVQNIAKHKDLLDKDVTAYWEENIEESLRFVKKSAIFADQSKGPK